MIIMSDEIKQSTTEEIYNSGIVNQHYQILGVVEGIYQKVENVTKRIKYVVADSKGRLDCIHFSKKKIDLKPDKYKALQEELKTFINMIMQNGKIKAVVFREFVVAQ